MSRIAFTAALAVGTVLAVGCAPDTTPVACAEVRSAVEAHPALTASEALALSEALADIAQRGAGDIETDLRDLSQALLTGDPDTALTAADAIDETCGWAP